MASLKRPADEELDTSRKRPMTAKPNPSEAAVS